MPKRYCASRLRGRELGLVLYDFIDSATNRWRSNNTELSYNIVVRYLFGYGALSGPMRRGRRDSGSTLSVSGPVRRTCRTPSGTTVSTDGGDAHIDSHASKPRPMQMLRAEYPLTPRAHAARPGLEAHAARVAVDGPHRLVENSQSEH